MPSYRWRAGLGGPVVAVVGAGQGAERVQREVALLDQPLVVLLYEQAGGEAQQGGVVG